MDSEDTARDFAFKCWWADSPETTLGTQQEGEAFNAGWAASRERFRPIRLAAPTVAGCPECAARRALEAATDPSERTLVLTLDEIKALLCAWHIEEFPKTLRNLKAPLASAEAKLKAAMNPRKGDQCQT